MGQNDVIEELQQRNDEMKKEKENLQAQYLATIEENNVFEEERDKLRVKNHELDQAIQALEIDLKQHKQQLEKVTAEKEELEAKLGTVHEEKHQLTESKE